MNCCAEDWGAIQKLRYDQYRQYLEGCEEWEEFEADPGEIFTNGLKFSDARRDPHRKKMLDHSKRDTMRGPHPFEVQIENRRFRSGAKQALQALTDEHEPVYEGIVYSPFRRTCRSLYC